MITSLLVNTSMRNNKEALGRMTFELTSANLEVPKVDYQMFTQTRVVEFGTEKYYVAHKIEITKVKD